MSLIGHIWIPAIVIFLLEFNFGVCENLHHGTNDPRRDLSRACTIDDPNNTSISCHGMRIVKRVIQQLLDSAITTNLEIVEGVRLVNTEDPGSAVRRARNLKEMGKIGAILGSFYGKELRIKVPRLMPDNFETAIKESLPTGREKGGGFGGGKKGDNGLLIMAVMMGKMMAAIGFGSLGMLAMKALMVSSLALMLSLIVAAKKFASSNDSGGSGHHVVYAQETGHHHSKRSVNFQNHEFSPYRGYASIYGTSGIS